MTDVREAQYVARTSDGRTVRRPMSPHLQVYKFFPIMAVSIFHRITGCALAFGAMLLVWWLVAAATSDAAFAFVSMVLHTWIGKLALIGWSAALMYHFCTGIRHLVWDCLYALDKAQIDLSVRVVLVGAAALTLATWAAAYLAH
jgi:succinate dehydrogenase / fumarate reductase, cytochrome b subunit